MAEEEEIEGWFKIREPPTGVLTAKMEETIRAFAREEGFPTLRGFHMRMRSLDWDFYDILQMAYE